MKDQFSDIIQIIKNARSIAFRAVNSELINLYWNVGAYISQKVEISEWGQYVVKELSEYIIKTEPEIKGFSDKNLWRMKQFYETYKDSSTFSPLVREISWSHNMIYL